ncbi:alpha/beta hydrolase family protein [Thermotoga profunda]|uniref:alpha/beta hydrolase family protein n=1 Tax=Thermotoga profunda TaxID=1508420 RepID=UPI000AD764D2|nr:alpha/beta hydrolase [Thermotoga profunda]
MKIYEYNPDLPMNIEQKNCGDYSIISFDAVYEPDVPESKKIYVYAFQPKDPWVNLIFLHGIGNGNIPYLLWFGKYFERYGVQTFFMILPYHENRAKPQWNGGEPFFSPSPSYCSKIFHQAVKDVRRTLDYVKKISTLPVSIMGFSFGGMIATMCLALDKRLENGVIAFAGGDWRWINWYSPYTEPLRKNYSKYSNEYNCVNESSCIKNRLQDFQKIGKLKQIDDIFSLFPACFHYDPIAYAQFVEQPILFFQGIFDKIIPYKSSQILFEKLPNAKKAMVFSGHKSSYIFRRYIAKRVIYFLRSTFSKGI